MLLNGTKEYVGLMLGTRNSRSLFPLIGCVLLFLRQHVFCVFKYSAVSHWVKAAIPWCSGCVWVVCLGWPCSSSRWFPFSVSPVLCVRCSFMMPVASPVVQPLNADCVLYTVLSFTAKRASTLQQRLKKHYIWKFFKKETFFSPFLICCIIINQTSLFNLQLYFFPQMLFFLFWFSLNIFEM